MENKNKISFVPDFFDIMILILMAFYFIFLLSVVNNRGMLGWDEAARSMGGVSLIKYLTGGLSFHDTVTALGINHYYVYQGTFLYGPLHAISSAAASLLFGFSAGTARLPVAIFGTLGLLVTYYICRLMYKDGRVGILAALFLVGSPMYFDFSTMVFSEVPITLALLTGTYLLFKVKKMYIDNEYNKTNINKGVYCVLVSVAAGIMFSFASLTKPSAALMIIPIGIYMLHAVISSKQYPVKKARRKKQEKPDNNSGLIKNRFFILSIPLLILGLSMIFYWSYLDDIGFYRLYINFWLGGRGFHPETEPFSLNILLESWKPVLAIFPVVVVSLLIAGLYQTIRRKPNSEEVFLLSWIGAYFLVLIASGAISPNYPLPMIPALAIFASTAAVKIIDLYKPQDIFKKKNPDEAWKLKWKTGISAILIAFIVFQAAMVPVYKSISLQSGNEIKGEAYNPLIIRTFLQKHVPFLFWINTRYYNGSAIDFYARNGLDEQDTDTYRSLEMNIVMDIQKNNYPSATVIFLSELSNYFDYWFTIDDKYLKYRFVSLEPGMLPQYAAQDPAPKYMVVSQDNEKKLIQNINKKESELKYSIYKLHIENNSIQLEEMNIDQVVKYA